MRIIAGKGRSLPLKTIEGIDTRPTTDRIKETLFNMLQYEIADCRFLDLFAGSGQIQKIASRDLILYDIKQCLFDTVCGRSGVKSFYRF